MACTFYRDKVAADRCQRREYISTEEEGTSPPASRRRKKEGKRASGNERAWGRRGGKRDPGQMTVGSSTNTGQHRRNDFDETVNTKDSSQSPIIDRSGSFFFL